MHRKGTHHTSTSTSRTTAARKTPARREIRAYTPSSSAGSSNSAEGGSSGGDAVVLALSIALGVAMVVVIVLICIYANKRNGDSDNDETDCRGSRDTRYIDIDVLAQKTNPNPVLLEAAPHVRTAATAESKPVLLSGPLNVAKMKADVLAKPRESLVSPHVLTSHFTSAAAVSKTGPGSGKPHAEINSERATELLKGSKEASLFVVSKQCGACVQFKRLLAKLTSEGDDMSKVLLLDTEEVKKLPEDIKKSFAVQYIPTQIKLGNGTAKIAEVGVPKKELLLSLQ